MRKDQFVVCEGKEEKSSIRTGIFLSPLNYVRRAQKKPSGLNEEGKEVSSIRAGICLLTTSTTNTIMYSILCIVQHATIS